MSGLACDQFYGHMEYGSCALYPKTGYNFNPDKFWGMSGYNVPFDQKVFGPPEGPPRSWSPTQENRYVTNQLTSYAKYRNIRQSMVELESKRARKAKESLDVFDRANANLMSHEDGEL